MKNILFLLFLFFINSYSQKKTIPLYKDSIEIDFFIKKEVFTSTNLVKDLNDKFRITLFDSNKNNIFNEIDIDYLIVSLKNEEEIRFNNGVSFRKIKKNNYIEANDVIYKVEEIDTNGNYIVLNKTNEYIIPTVKLVNKLPDIDFKKISGEFISFNEYLHKNKYVFIEFWGSWCEGCLKALPKFKEIYKTHNDELIFIYLNSRDSKELVENFIKENKISDWENGYSNKFIEEELLLNGYPYGVLFDDNGNVVKFACSYNDLEEIFKKDGK